MGSIAGSNPFFRVLRQDISKEEFQRLITEFVNTLPQQIYGTYTPTLAGASTAGTQTYGTQKGRWVRTGRVVWFSASIILTAKDGTTAGGMRVSLPFTSVTDTGLLTSVAVGGQSGWDLNVAGGYYAMAARIPSNSTHVNLMEVGDNVAEASLLAADFGDTSEVHVAGSYEAA